METQGKDGDLLGVSLSPPALTDEQSTSEAAAEALQRAAAAGKEVAKASPVATLDDLTKMESSIMANLETMLIKIMGGGSGSKPPPENSVLHVPVTGTPSQDGGARPSLHAVAPPMSYADVPLKMPHISMHGNPLKLDTTNFALWQFIMESHLKSCSIEVWNIIDRGFTPVFPNDLTRREVVDCQLNATA